MLFRSENYVISEGDYFLEDYVGKTFTFTSRFPQISDTAYSVTNNPILSSNLVLEKQNVQLSDTINISKTKILSDEVVSTDTGGILLYDYTDDIAYFAEQYVGEFSTLT